MIVIVIDMNNIELAAAATAAGAIVFDDIAAEIVRIVFVHIQLIQIGQQFAILIKYRAKPIDFISRRIDIRVL